MIITSVTVLILLVQRETTARENRLYILSKNVMFQLMPSYLYTWDRFIKYTMFLELLLLFIQPQKYCTRVLYLRNNFKEYIQFTITLSNNPTTLLVFELNND